MCIKATTVKMCSTNGQKSKSVETHQSKVQSANVLPQLESNNFLFVNTHEESIKLLDIDRHHRSGCMCVTRQTRNDVMGWSNNISNNNGEADDYQMCSRNYSLPEVNRKLPALSKQKLLNSYQSRLQPYISYPSYESSYERSYRTKFKPYMFHHYDSVQQYIEQYRMFHSSVPYAEKKTKPESVVDPEWNPHVYKVNTPSPEPR